jgi:hypothetical protein
MKELLIKLRDEVSRECDQGICTVLNQMEYDDKINLEEYSILKSYLRWNLPPKEFSPYCWPLGEKEPRIKWLNEQIAKFEGEKKVSFWTKIKGIFMPKK